MRLNRLFESDERLRTLQRRVRSDPGDKELWNQYKRMLLQSGEGSLESIVSNDEAMLKCAEYLENSILNNRLFTDNLDKISEIIDGIKEHKGNFFQGGWNDQLNVLHAQTRDKWLTDLLVNLGDLLRSVYRPLDKTPRTWYLNNFVRNLDLDEEELIKIAYL